MKSLMSFSLTVIVCVGLSTVARADTFNTGDVFLGTSGTSGVLHYDGSGNFLESLTSTVGGFKTGMAFDSSGNLYGTNFSSGNISQYTGPLDPHTHSIYANADSSSSVESIVFNAAGDFYVGQADGTRDILKFDSAGNFLARYDVATEDRGSDWIDLAADQTTMYYTSEGRAIYRYDVATDTQLADFATLPGSGHSYALRLLGDGGLLVADTSNIKRLDSSGSVIQTYDIAGNQSWFALNLDPDGTSFWTGSFDTSGTFAKFDIATGANLGTYYAGSQVWGVTVFGEVTQGVVPVPGAVLLGMLGLSVVGVKLRKHA